MIGYFIFAFILAISGVIISLYIIGKDDKNILQNN